MADESDVLAREVNTASGVLFGGAIDVDLLSVPTSRPIPDPTEATTVGQRIIALVAHVWRNLGGLIGSIIWSSWVIVWWILQLLTDITPILRELYFTDSMIAEFQPFNPYAHEEAIIFVIAGWSIWQYLRYCFYLFLLLRINSLSRPKADLQRYESLIAGVRKDFQYIERLQNLCNNSARDAQDARDRAVEAQTAAQTARDEVTAEHAAETAGHAHEALAGRGRTEEASQRAEEARVAAMKARDEVEKEAASAEAALTKVVAAQIAAEKMQTQIHALQKAITAGTKKAQDDAYIVLEEMKRFRDGKEGDIQLEAAGAGRATQEQGASAEQATTKALAAQAAAEKALEDSRGILEEVKKLQSGYERGLQGGPPKNPDADIAYWQKLFEDFVPKVKEAVMLNSNLITIQNIAVNAAQRAAKAADSTAVAIEQFKSSLGEVAGTASDQSFIKGWSGLDPGQQQSHPPGRLGSAYQLLDPLIPRGQRRWSVQGPIMVDDTLLERLRALHGLGTLSEEIGGARKILEPQSHRASLEDEKLEGNESSDPEPESDDSSGRASLSGIRSWDPKDSTCKFLPKAWKLKVEDIPQKDPVEPRRGWGGLNAEDRKKKILVILKKRSATISSLDIYISRGNQWGLEELEQAREAYRVWKSLWFALRGPTDRKFKWAKPGKGEYQEQPRTNGLRMLHDGLTNLIEVVTQISNPPHVRIKLDERQAMKLHTNKSGQLYEIPWVYPYDQGVAARLKYLGRRGTAGSGKRRRQKQAAAESKDGNEVRSDSSGEGEGEEWFETAGSKELETDETQQTSGAAEFVADEASRASRFRTRLSLISPSSGASQFQIAAPLVNVQENIDETGSTFSRSNPLIWITGKGNQVLGGAGSGGGLGAKTGPGGTVLKAQPEQPISSRSQFRRSPETLTAGITEIQQPGRTGGTQQNTTTEASTQRPADLPVHMLTKPVPQYQETDQYQKWLADNERNLQGPDVTRCRQERERFFKHHADYWRKTFGKYDEIGRINWAAASSRFWGQPWDPAEFQNGGTPQWKYPFEERPSVVSWRSRTAGPALLSEFYREEGLEGQTQKPGSSQSYTGQGGMADKQVAKADTALRTRMVDYATRGRRGFESGSSASIILSRELMTNIWLRTCSDQWEENKPEWETLPTPLQDLHDEINRNLGVHSGQHALSWPRGHRRPPEYKSDYDAVQWLLGLAQPSLPESITQRDAPASGIISERGKGQEKEGKGEGEEGRAKERGKEREKEAGEGGEKEQGKERKKDARKERDKQGGKEQGKVREKEGRKGGQKEQGMERKEEGRKVEDKESGGGSDSGGGYFLISALAFSAILGASKHRSLPKTPKTPKTPRTHFRERTQRRVDAALAMAKRWARREKQVQVITDKLARLQLKFASCRAAKASGSVQVRAQTEEETAAATGQHQAGGVLGLEALEALVLHSKGVDKARRDFVAAQSIAIADIEKYQLQKRLEKEGAKGGTPAYVTLPQQEQVARGVEQKAAVQAAVRALEHVCKLYLNTLITDEKRAALDAWFAAPHGAPKGRNIALWSWVQLEALMECPVHKLAELGDWDDNRFARIGTATVSQIRQWGWPLALRPIQLPAPVTFDLSKFHRQDVLPFVGPSIDPGTMRPTEDEKKRREQLGLCPFCAAEDHKNMALCWYRVVRATEMDRVALWEWMSQHGEDPFFISRREAARLKIRRKTASLRTTPIFSVEDTVYPYLGNGICPISGRPSMEEVERRRIANLCLFCSESGHLWSSCLKRETTAIEMDTDRFQQEIDMTKFERMIEKYIQDTGQEFEKAIKRIFDETRMEIDTEEQKKLEDLQQSYEDYHEGYMQWQREKNYSQAEDDREYWDSMEIDEGLDTDESIPWSDCGEDMDWTEGERSGKDTMMLDNTATHSQEQYQQQQQSLEHVQERPRQYTPQIQPQGAQEGQAARRILKPKSRIGPKASVMQLLSQVVQEPTTKETQANQGFQALAGQGNLAQAGKETQSQVGQETQPLGSQGGTQAARQDYSRLLPSWQQQKQGQEAARQEEKSFQNEPSPIAQLAHERTAKEAQASQKSQALAGQETRAQVGQETQLLGSQGGTQAAGRDYSRFLPSRQQQKQGQEAARQEKKSSQNEPSPITQLAHERTVKEAQAGQGNQALAGQVNQAQAGQETQSQTVQGTQAPDTKATRRDWLTFLSTQQQQSILQQEGQVEEATSQRDKEEAKGADRLQLETEAYQQAVGERLQTKVSLGAREIEKSGMGRGMEDQQTGIGEEESQSQAQTEAKEGEERRLRESEQQEQQSRDRQECEERQTSVDENEAAVAERRRVDNFREQAGREARKIGREREEQRRRRDGETAQAATTMTATAGITSIYPRFDPLELPGADALKKVVTERPFQDWLRRNFDGPEGPEDPYTWWCVLREVQKFIRVKMMEGELGSMDWSLHPCRTTFLQGQVRLWGALPEVTVEDRYPWLLEIIPVNQLGRAQAPPVVEEGDFHLPTRAASAPGGTGSRGRRTRVRSATPDDGEVHVELQRDPADEASSEEERERAEIERCALIMRPKSMGAWHAGTKEHDGSEITGDNTSTQGNQEDQGAEGKGDGDSSDISSISHSSTRNEEDRPGGSGTGGIVRAIMPIPTARRERFRGLIPAMPLPTGFCQLPPEHQTPQHRAQEQRKMQSMTEMLAEGHGVSLDEHDDEKIKLGKQSDQTTLLQSVNHLVLPTVRKMELTVNMNFGNTSLPESLAITHPATTGSSTTSLQTNPPTSPPTEVSQVLPIAPASESLLSPVHPGARSLRSGSPRAGQKDRPARKFSLGGSSEDNKGKKKGEGKGTSDGSTTEKDSPDSNKEMAHDYSTYTDEELRARIGMEIGLGLVSTMYRPETEEYKILEVLNERELERERSTRTVRLPTQLVPPPLPSPPPRPVPRPQAQVPMEELVDYDAAAEEGRKKAEMEQKIKDVASRTAIMSDDSHSSDWEERDDTAFADSKKRRGVSFVSEPGLGFPFEHKRKKSSDGSMIHLTGAQVTGPKIPPCLGPWMNMSHVPRSQSQTDIEGTEVMTTEDPGEQGDDEGDGGSESMDVDSGTQRRLQLSGDSESETQEEEVRRVGSGHSLAEPAISIFRPSTEASLHTDRSRSRSSADIIASSLNSMLFGPRNAMSELESPARTDMPVTTETVSDEVIEETMLDID